MHRVHDRQLFKLFRLRFRNQKRFASSLPRRSVARMGRSPFSWVRRGRLLGLAPISGMAMEQLWKVSSKSGARGNDRHQVS